jgi:hypothetical protein
MLIALGAVAFCSASALAADKPAPLRSTLSDGALTVDIVDLSPQFLAWYAAAKAAPDADARFKLWQQLYGFAAVPPGPEGAAMARKLVDEAWPRYGEAVAPAKVGAAGMQPQPMAILHRVAEILEVKQPVHIQLITYVGGFENNAFSYRGELPVVAIPLESQPQVRAATWRTKGPTPSTLLSPASAAAGSGRWRPPCCRRAWPCTSPARCSPA